MADDLDVITLAEAQTALKLDRADNDTELEAWITAVSRRIDDLCGPVVQRIITDELHLDPSGYLWPHQTPVVSITNVKEWSSGTATTLTAESHEAAGDYRFDSRLGVITRRSGWGDSTWANYVTLTYVAGRYATTDDVDPLFKQAAVIVLTHLWRASGTGRGGGGSEFWEGVEGSNVFGTPPFSIPRAAIELLGSEVRAPAIA